MGKLTQILRFINLLEVFVTSANDNEGSPRAG
jgi:hypothetical protein